ncbi:MAG: hypothetical protein AAF623_07300 [Planctomycetota bacterium]
MLPRSQDKNDESPFLNVGLDFVAQNIIESALWTDRIRFEFQYLFSILNHYGCPGNSEIYRSGQVPSEHPLGAKGFTIPRIWTRDVEK